MPKSTLAASHISRSLSDSASSAITLMHRDWRRRPLSLPAATRQLSLDRRPIHARARIIRAYKAHGATAPIAKPASAAAASAIAHRGIGETLNRHADAAILRLDVGPQSRLNVDRRMTSPRRRSGALKSLVSSWAARNEEHCRVAVSMPSAESGQSEMRAAAYPSNRNSRASRRAPL